MDTYRVYDNDEPLEFTGVLLGEGSTETETSDRWTEVLIYKTEGGNYIINRVGRSVRYHRHDGPCNTGVPTPAVQLDVDDHLPCPVCRPPHPHDLDGDALVDLELDKETAAVCTADKVYQTLLMRRYNKFTQQDESFLSNPAARAYHQALLADEDLANAAAPVRHIS
jgi:hypothetical protein